MMKNEKALKAAKEQDSSPQTIEELELLLDSQDAITKSYPATSVLCFKLLGFLRRIFTLVALVSVLLKFYGFDKMILVPKWKISENLEKMRSPAGFGLMYENITISSLDDENVKLRGWFIYKDDSDSNFTAIYKKSERPTLLYLNS